MRLISGREKVKMKFSLSVSCIDNVLLTYDTDRKSRFHEFRLRILLVNFWRGVVEGERRITRDFLLLTEERREEKDRDGCQHKSARGCYQTVHVVKTGASGRSKKEGYFDAYFSDYFTALSSV
jgi:hypothetical protein